MISYLVLPDSDYYESVKKRLCNRFPPEGNVIEWQQRLRSRSKERLEVLEDLAMFCYRTFLITFVEKHVIKLFYLPLISPRPLSNARACMQCLQSVIYNFSAHVHAIVLAWLRHSYAHVHKLGSLRTRTCTPSYGIQCILIHNTSVNVQYTCTHQLYMW